MVVSKENFYFLDWELIAPLNQFFDLTHGNEFIEIYIRDLSGCQEICNYTLPLTQPGRLFAPIKLHLLYPKHKCVKKPQHILVSIRIVRGHKQQLIYTSDFVLLAPDYYTSVFIQRIPIYRVWYYEDYYKMILANMFF